jgi:RNA polymerase sigma factor (sigma-70 family)
MSKRRERGATLEEIEVVYRTRLPQFRRVAAGIVGDRELARDAVQDAFAVAVRRRETFRRDGSLEGWLWRIVVNTARSAGRGRPPVSVGGNVEATNAADEGDDRVRSALGGLPERQRLVIFLRYYADLDYRTIAQAAGIAPGTVAATVSAAHASLRKVLEEVAT